MVTSSVIVSYVEERSEGIVRGSLAMASAFLVTNSKIKWK
jgi:hypothetical protein